jgi:hypothetical protein
LTASRFLLISRSSPGFFDTVPPCCPAGAPAKALSIAILTMKRGLRPTRTGERRVDGGEWLASDRALD